MEKVLERYIYTHFNIKIGVEIDYPRNKVSFVKLDGMSEAKSFVFANRGVEYMDGWLEILAGLAEATKDAKARLLAYQKAKEDNVTRLIMKAEGLLQKEAVKNKRKK